MNLNGRLVCAFVLVLAFLGLSGALWLQTSRLAKAQDSLVAERVVTSINAEAAKQCSSGVDELQKKAAQSAADAASAIQSAQKRADNLQARAQRQIAAKPSTPGNDCKSAADRFDQWLIERNQ